VTSGLHDLPQRGARGAHYEPPAKLLRLHHHSLMNLLVVGGDARGRRKVAEAFHSTSLLRLGPFVSIDAERNEPLIARALYGWLSPARSDVQAHALTGAERGTLFIDGVTTLSKPTQRLLLAFSRLCSPEPVVGGIAWTGRLAVGAGEDPALAVSDGRFSAPLLDCLDKIRIEIAWPARGAA
jgi:DNA-binding NtrC family response regulator